MHGLWIKTACSKQTEQREKQLSTGRSHPQNLARRSALTCDLDKSVVRWRAKTLRWRWLALVFLYAAVGVPGLGRAQDLSAANVRSQKLFAAALDAKRSGDLPRALCLMQGAQRAWSKPAFSFNVAQLQRELGLCAEARANYQAFLNHERDAARRKQAELALAELAECTQRAVEPPAAGSCTAWEAEALRASAGVTETGNRNDRVVDDPLVASSAAAISGGASDGGAPDAGKANAHAVATAGSGGSDGGAPDPVKTRAHVVAPARGAASSARVAAPSPGEVARAQVTPRSPPLVAAPGERPPGTKRGVRQYLPWILAGVGVVCVALSGYELAQVVSSSREVNHAENLEAEKAARAEGRTAYTFLWVFGAGATVSLGSALVLALTDNNDPPPSASSR
jgi:hypothetical protein